MRKRWLFLLLIPCIGASECDSPRAQPVSTTGVKKAVAQVQTDATGNSVEQKNILERIKRDNQPGSIKHLYVISPMSGDVLIYSTVMGKVTSSGKRLTPNSVAAQDGQYVSSEHTGFLVNVGGLEKRTPEVLQDDGTYGSSAEYLFWFDSQGRYHQHYAGNSIVHISDQPLSIGKVILNLDPSFGKSQ